MKEKLSILLCAFAALFLGSCADLSVDEEKALKVELPNDFDWKVYAEINQDVASSQIIFDVRKRNKVFSGADSAKNAISNCFNLLKNEKLAEEIYLTYAACPKQGWNRNEKCPGRYAYNANYWKPTVNSTTKDTTWQCIIGASTFSENCWRGGWDDSGENKENLKLLKDSLPDYLAKLQTSISFAPVRTMCMFLPEFTEPSKALAYLKDFELDSLLVIEHYNPWGISDGRPYKYCKPEDIGAEKSQNLELVTHRGTYYDYGKYTFCFNKSDQKIYVVK